MDKDHWPCYLVVSGALPLAELLSVYQQEVRSWGYLQCPWYVVRNPGRMPHNRYCAHVIKGACEAREQTGVQLQIDALCPGKFESLGPLHS